MAFDVYKIRKDFPILSRLVHNKPLIYLDNGATTQKPTQVLEALDRVYREYNSNIHRGVHYLSGYATEAYEGARKTVAEFINADTDETIFTRGTTESINLVAFSFGEAFLEAGDEIILSDMEHHSNIVPWQMVAQRKGASIKVFRSDMNGELDVNLLDSLITSKTKLIAITHVSNALGTINPIKEIIDIAHKRGVKILIDGAQAIQHIKVDVKALDCDFYVFSGHKLYGPNGIGILYGKKELLNAMPPYQGGGEMIKSVTFENTTYNELPFKFEAGTPDYVAAIGLAEAINYLNGIGFHEIEQYEHELYEYTERQLSSIEGIRFIGRAKNRTSLFSFLINDIHPFDMGTLLDKLGIAIRTGHHCAQPVMDKFKIPGTVRASLAFYNTKEEIDELVKSIKLVTNILS